MVNVFASTPTFKWELQVGIPRPYPFSKAKDLHIMGIYRTLTKVWKVQIDSNAYRLLRG